MIDREHSYTPNSSLRQQTFKLLERNHELKPKDLCKLMGLNYKIEGGTITQYRKQWKREYKNREALKCLSFHNTIGRIVALKLMDRAAAVEVGGWVQTRARNRMLLWRDARLGRLEWHVTGTVKVWIKRPATWGRVKQLLANAFFATGLVRDVQVFDLWASSARFKGSHLVYDTGERLPYAKIEYLKEALGVVVKTGDVSHPTGIEIEFTYPDWAERNEVLLQQNSKLMEMNSQALRDFSDFMKGLSQPRAPKERADREMLV